MIKVVDGPIMLLSAWAEGERALIGFSCWPRLVKLMICVLYQSGSSSKRQAKGCWTRHNTFTKVMLGNLHQGKMHHQSFSSVLMTIGYCTQIIKAVQQEKTNGPVSAHPNLQDSNSGWLLGKEMLRTTLVELGHQEANAFRMQAFSYMWS